MSALGVDGAPAPDVNNGAGIARQLRIYAALIAQENRSLGESPRGMAHALTSGQWESILRLARELTRRTSYDSLSPDFTDELWRIASGYETFALPVPGPKAGAPR